MINFKELNLKIIVIHILTILTMLFILMTIFINYNPELLKIIESQDFNNKKLENYIIQVTMIQLSSFFLSALIISFIRKKQDYNNGIFAIIIFLLPISIINATNLLNIIMAILSILIAGIISYAGIWFGYYLRPIKEEK